MSLKFIEIEQREGGSSIRFNIGHSHWPLFGLWDESDCSYRYLSGDWKDHWPEIQLDPKHGGTCILTELEE